MAGLTESAGATAIRASGTERTGCSFWTAAAGRFGRRTGKPADGFTIVDALSNWNGDGRIISLAYRRGGGVMPALYGRKR